MSERIDCPTCNAKDVAEHHPERCDCVNCGRVA